MNAASPGVIALFFRNDHYATREEYVYAIADAMRAEYEAITNAGLHAADRLPGPRHGPPHPVRGQDARGVPHARRSSTSRRSTTRPATSTPSAMRIHVCWGNYEGPHHCDVPTSTTSSTSSSRREPEQIAMEAANPRHAHEWKIFEDVKLPDGKVLIPGVIESKSNFIEHPELIAQRIRRYADLVGDENVPGRQRLRLRHVGRPGRRRPRRRVGEAARPPRRCRAGTASCTTQHTSTVPYGDMLRRLLPLRARRGPGRRHRRTSAQAVPPTITVTAPIGQAANSGHRHRQGRLQRRATPTRSPVEIYKGDKAEGKPIFSNVVFVNESTREFSAFVDTQLAERRLQRPRDPDATASRRPARSNVVVFWIGPPPVESPTPTPVAVAVAVALTVAGADRGRAAGDRDADARRPTPPTTKPPYVCKSRRDFVKHVPRPSQGQEPQGHRDPRRQAVQAHAEPQVRARARSTCAGCRRTPTRSRSTLKFTRPDGKRVTKNSVQRVDYHTCVPKLRLSVRRSGSTDADRPARRARPSGPARRPVPARAPRTTRRRPARAAIRPRAGGSG